MSRFIFKQMTMEDMPIYADEIFSILAGNMREIAPTGNSYDEDYKIWLGYFESARREEKNHVILIFCDETLCGCFQYAFHDTTFRMEEIQFKPEYQGSGLFAELYRHLISMIPEHIFSALGPAAGNSDLIFFISMFGELLMVLFLYLYSRKEAC